MHYENYRVCRLNESHLLPQGPGWVNLAPTPAGRPATPRSLKVCQQAQDDAKDEAY